MGSPHGWQTLELARPGSTRQARQCVVVARANRAGEPARTEIREQKAYAAYAVKATSSGLEATMTNTNESKEALSLGPLIFILPEPRHSTGRGNALLRATEGVRQD